MKKQKVQEESDDEDEGKETKKQGFGNDLEQVWYKRSSL